MGCDANSRRAEYLCRTLEIDSDVENENARRCSTGARIEYRPVRPTYFFGFDSSLISIGLPSPVTEYESLVCAGLL